RDAWRRLCWRRLPPCRASPRSRCRPNDTQREEPAQEPTGERSWLTIRRQRAHGFVEKGVPCYLDLVNDRSCSGGLSPSPRDARGAEEEARRVPARTARLRCGTRGLDASLP